MNIEKQTEIADEGCLLVSNMNLVVEKFLTVVCQYFFYQRTADVFCAYAVTVIAKYIFYMRTLHLITENKWTSGLPPLPQM